MPSEVSTCDHVSRRSSSAATAAGVLPFLLALVLAVPLAHGGSPVSVSDTTTSPDATATSPALAPTPDGSYSTAPAPAVTTSAVDTVAPDTAAPDAVLAPVVGPVSPAPVVGPVAPDATTATVTSGTEAAAATAPTSSPTALPDATATTAATVRRSIWKSGGTRVAVPMTAPGTTAAVRPSPAPSTGTEGVVNPSGATGTAGWEAGSAGGPVSVTRVTGVSGPFAQTTALQLDGASTGDWALALAAIANPVGFFTVGKSYTMSAWVRDLNASGKSIGLLVADNHYASMPSDVSVYEGYRDTGWHLLSRTFVATSRAGAGTGVYLALPENTSAKLQVTGVSVREEGATAPVDVTVAPTRRITFAGSAGSAPDAGVWNAETGGGGWGNGELETYTDRTSNASVDGAGNLVITARREDYAASDGILRHYTSARLTTEGKFAVQPGSYVEAKITAPVGSSVWPAFWLLGTNIRQVGWPASGELDVLEGAGAEPTKAFNAAHMALLADPHTDSQYGWGGSGTVDVGSSLDSGPHLYGVHFDGTAVRFYVDRRLVRTITAADAAATGRSWPFGKPQFVILNVAVAGDAGDPASTSFPRTMTVGGISVWEGGVPF